LVAGFGRDLEVIVGACCRRIGIGQAGMG
jgi:hypothetical protein